MNDNERVELNELCSALVDGHATEAQQQRLGKLLGCSEEAREFYVRTMGMSASLFEHAGEMQCDAPEPANVIRPVQWRRWLVPFAAAASIAIAMMVARHFPGASSEPGEEQTDTIARLSGSKDCQWGGKVPLPGEDLLRGQRLELRSGVAEVTFDSGAQVVFEGPVTLNLRSQWETELLRGTLKANVPAEATGFRVTNAAVEVVDLGAEFSMTADEAGAAEVFVHRGSVEVRSRDAGGKLMPKSVLLEKQAKRFAKAGPSDVRDRDRKFVGLARKSPVDRLLRATNYVRWSFDEGAGDIAAATSNTQTDGHISFEPAPDGESARTDGRWGKAVWLGRGMKATAKLPAPVIRNARTVALWAQIPADAPRSEPGSLVGFSANRAGHPWAEVSWNHLPSDGVYGALRLDTGPASAIGTTSLRDGKWHHLAAVFSQSGKNGGKLHAKFYVDGRLEPLSLKPVMHSPVEKLPAELAGLLWLGGRPGSSERPHAAIDELFIADRPLTPQEIRHLMKTNELMSPEGFAAN